MADEPMTEPSNNASFTQKEMLVRIDAKVDVIAAKQAHYDVELALVKAHAEENKQAIVRLERSVQVRDDAIMSELADAKNLMATEVASLKQGQFNVGRAIKTATAVIVAVGLVSDALIRFFSR